MRHFLACFFIFMAGAAAADCRDQDSYRQIDRCSAAFNNATTDSKRGEALLYRCQAYDGIGQHAVALIDCRDAEKYLPRDGSVHNSISIVHQNLENWTAAIGAATVAVSLNGANGNFWNTLANANCGAGNAERSVDARLKAMETGRFTPSQLQEILKARGYYNGAIDGSFGSGSKRALLAWSTAGC